MVNLSLLLPGGNITGVFSGWGDEEAFRALPQVSAPAKIGYGGKGKATIFRLNLFSVVSIRDKIVYLALLLQHLIGGALKNVTSIVVDYVESYTAAYVTLEGLFRIGYNTVVLDLGKAKVLKSREGLGYLLTEATIRGIA